MRGEKQIHWRDNVRRGCQSIAAFAWLVLLPPLHGQAPSTNFANLTNHLNALVYRLPSVDPLLAREGDGPKSIVAADLDGDGKMDFAAAGTEGSITIYFGKVDGQFERPPKFLRTTPFDSLRGMVAADWDGDGRPDLAVAAPYSGRIYLFRNQSSGALRSFSSPIIMTAWRGVRNLAAGDFDGDQRPELVAAGPGLGLRVYRFGQQTNEFNLTWLNYQQRKPEDFPKPVYSMKRFRPANSNRDWLAVTHAETNVVWLLQPDPNGDGGLSFHSVVYNTFAAHGLEIGPVFHPAGSHIDDLIAVGRDGGVLEIHRASTNLSKGWFETNSETLNIAGGPRAVALTDLDRDGWNELIVVQRNLDSLQTYANRAGVLSLMNAQAVGASPREVVTADWDGDMHPDAAVLNRESGDISILMAHKEVAGFRALDHLYAVDGNVVGLVVMDFNGDGRDDVVQLHRASGDFSVRLAGPGGMLGPPAFYTVGHVPASQIFVDVNDDTVPDVVTANLGTERLERGSVSVRLGNGDGTFGEEKTFQLPDEAPDGRLFGLVPGRFDGDGTIDLVAGLLDSRLVFFRGNADGTFNAGPVRLFVPQARALVAAKLDGDEYADLAGVGVTGEIWVMLNPGPPTYLMDAVSPTILRYDPPEWEGGKTFGARRLLAVDYDKDDVKDLIMGSGEAAWLYLGSTNGGYHLVTPPRLLAGLSNLISDLFFEDLDKDGNKDLVISCRGQDCLSVLLNNSTGLASVDAPATHFIAMGDLDADGKPDLVGTGRVLWTALSSHGPSDAPPASAVTTETRERMTNIVINEILALNTKFPVGADGKRTVDWIELYNAVGAYSLNGWRLTAIQGDEEDGKTDVFEFPDTATIGANGYLLLICSDVQRSLYHTGWRLSGDGGTLVLTDSSNRVVDRLVYPPQRPNVSYGRYRDGLRSFVYNPFPSPGRANPINGTVEPLLQFAGVDPESFGGSTLRLYADVADDIAVSSLSMYYERIDPGAFVLRERVELYDTGRVGDLGAASRRYAADIPSSPPAEIEFYFELMDLNDQLVIAPDEAQFSTVTAPGSIFQLKQSLDESPVEISELLAAPPSAGTNTYPDWLEVRNTSDQFISMNGMAISHQFGENARYFFPTGLVLQPGQHLVVYCDDRLDLGEGHAPFRLGQAGDMVMLTGMTTNGSRTLVDWVQFSRQETNRSWARLGAKGPFHAATPTPATGNVPSVVVDGRDRGWTGEWFDVGGTRQYFIGFPTQPGVPYLLQFTPSLSPPAWTPVEQFIGTGIEHAFRSSPQNDGFYLWQPKP